MTNALKNKKLASAALAGIIAIGALPLRHPKGRAEKHDD